jgi:hypothetical protein
MDVPETPPRGAPSTKSPPRVRTKRQQAQSRNVSVREERVLAAYETARREALREHVPSRPRDVGEVFEQRRAFFASALSLAEQFAHLDLDALVDPEHYDGREVWQVTLELCLDLDPVSDALVLTRVQARLGLVDDDDEEAHEDLACVEEGPAKYEPHPFASYYEIENTIADFQRAASAVRQGGAYRVPDFPRLFSGAGRRDAFVRRVRNSYHIDDDTELPRALHPLAARSFEEVLVEHWLELHDAAFLERAYGLVAPQGTTLPRLVDEARFVELLARGEEDTMRSFVARPPAPEPQLEDRQLLRDLYVRAIVGGDEQLTVFEISAPRLFIVLGSEGQRPLEVQRHVAKYFELLDAGCTFFEDRLYHDSRGSAAAALFRLKRLVPLAGLAREVAAAAPPTNALRGPYASLAPRQGGFTAMRPSSYTRTDAERRWRELCAAGTETAAEVGELRRIAQGLDIAMTSATARGLCRAIAGQLEAEFGERARLREAARSAAAPSYAAVAAAGTTLRSPTTAEVESMLAAANTSKRRRNPPPPQQ